MSQVVVPDMCVIPGERRLFVREMPAANANQKGVKEFEVIYAGNFEERLRDDPKKITATPINHGDKVEKTPLRSYVARYVPAINS